MTDHVNLLDSELHEPKGMQVLTGGASDVGKVVVSKGDGTTETRKLDITEIEGAESILLSGAYFDDNMATATVDVATELKESYLIGAAPTQVIQLQLPDPAVYAGAPITLKRLDANHGDGSEVKFIPNASETIEGASELAITLQNTSIVVVSDGTDWHIRADIYPVKFKHGWFNYNDLATQSTPINHTGGVDTKLTNDALGPATLVPYPPEGVTKVWDATTNQFDFTELVNGDTVDIRLDLEITTTSANQEITVYILLGVGGTTINVPIIGRIVKTAGANRIVQFSSVFMGGDNTRLNPAELYISSPSNATVKVNGWYNRIIGVNPTY
ncbi:hypothetical protein [Vibrio phage VpV262]|uniref:Uncharacterized protein n=1 Tax=Vibrio phage VpV262 TaxID=2907796 RepID=Q8LT49_9CAUD|nr:hypothetical protein VpV262p55 [Vibrio phage VpV262]AAM28404.1 hypothetical protein [Vibrio phage VpV262]